MKQEKSAIVAQRIFLDDCLRYGPFSTFSKMCDAAGMDYSRIYKAAKGEQSISIHTMQRLAYACGLTLHIRARF